MATRQVYVGSRFSATIVGDDDAAVARALDDEYAQRVMVTDGTNLLRAVRRPGDRFRLMVIDQRGGKKRKAFGHASTTRAGVDRSVAEAALRSFLARTDDWQRDVPWARGLAGRSPYLLIPAVFVVGTAAALAVQAATGNLDGWSWEYVPNLLVGVGVVSLITMYAAFFTGVVRPALAAWLGGAMGLEIVESSEAGFFSRPGHWETEDGTDAQRWKIALVDVVVLLVGAIVPIAAIAVGVILAARPILA